MRFENFKSKDLTINLVSPKHYYYHYYMLQVGTQSIFTH